MPGLQRILCPIDFSDASRRALDHATTIARWYRSRLTAMYVVSPLFVPMPPILFAEAAPNLPHLTEKEIDDVAARVRTWLAPAAEAGIETDVRIEEGNQPASSVLAYAAAWPADLVVLGTHGRSGFDRLLLGSVTEKILRKAPCPVMTVPPPVASTSNLPYKSILCPVDFSQPSMAALDLAKSMAKESDAALTLAHAVEWTDGAFPVDSPFRYAEFRRRYEEDLSRRLEALITADERTWCRPTTTVLHGKPYEAILESAREKEADLIVMGVHSRSAVDRVLFGSTTNHVVRQATCPVLTLVA